ncbi:hypothetical protein MVES_002246 [Malassezia vespertilionis]|uniref:F-box domain-containing protein n=1 Tax=Malassezia vespertilionis TaxID=2020962 RepID=A0A2N1JC96_9BASI|nr:hypothetical protein MVES_002246 [Malassezia vespertilionis]
MGRDQAVLRVPMEVWERILLLLDPEEVVHVRQASRAMYQAGTSFSLWRCFAAQNAQFPIPAVPHVPIAQQERALEHAVLKARHLTKCWATPGCIPHRAIRFRAHVHRITTVKIVIGDTRRTSTGRIVTDAWLITGSVDGYVRVWDVQKALRLGGRLDVMSEFVVDEEAVDDMSTCDEEDAKEESDPMKEIKRHSRTILLAEVDTGGDVTSLDAQLHADRHGMTIAVGSYYSSAACLVYDLNLHAMPHVLDLRASLDPPEWCGTQCVSLLESSVAVGSYLGNVYVLDWKAGERTVIGRHGSVAALRLFPRHVLAATRLGGLEVYAVHAASAPQSDTPIAQYTLSPHALLSVSISDCRPCISAGLMPMPGEKEASLAPLSIAIVDPTGLVHVVLDPCESCEFPYTFPPRLVAHCNVAHERLIGASLGASGKRAVLATSLGGLPPQCAIRAYTNSDTTLVPLRPTPAMVMPGFARERSSVPLRRAEAEDGQAGTASLAVQGASAALSPTSAASPNSIRERTRRSGRVDSFSSSSTSSVPSPSPRVDMLTESVIDEARGLVCLASVRGAIWIAEYCM